LYCVVGALARWCRCPHCPTRCTGFTLLPVPSPFGLRLPGLQLCPFICCRWTLRWLVWLPVTHPDLLVDWICVALPLPFGYVTFGLVLFGFGLPPLYSYGLPILDWIWIWNLAPVGLPLYIWLDLQFPHSWFVVDYSLIAQVTFGLLPALGWFTHPHTVAPLYPLPVYLLHLRYVGLPVTPLHTVVTFTLDLHLRLGYFVPLPLVGCPLADGFGFARLDYTVCPATLALGCTPHTHTHYLGCPFGHTHTPLPHMDTHRLPGSRLPGYYPHTVLYGWVPFGLDYHHTPVTPLHPCRVPLGWITPWLDLPDCRGLFTWLIYIWIMVLGLPRWLQFTRTPCLVQLDLCLWTRITVTVWLLLFTLHVGFSVALRLRYVGLPLDCTVLCLALWITLGCPFGFTPHSWVGWIAVALWICQLRLRLVWFYVGLPRLRLRCWLGTLRCC